MAKLLQNVFVVACALLLSLLNLSGVEGGSYGRRRLFVFGDSYADTGNINKSFGGSWKVPYGVTFPGHPSGRFSDGRVLTDFIAMLLKQSSPIPYVLRKLAPMETRCGVNFAYGGTGVFDTIATILVGLPNMTTQIDHFHQMLTGNDAIRIDAHLADSIAYVSVVGNDYATFRANSGSDKDLPVFISKVVNQLAQDLQRILSLGFKTVLVNGLQPIGCSPVVTTTDSFQECNTASNQPVQLHNLLLQHVVANLNKENQIRHHTHKNSIHILDLYNSFFTVFLQKDAYSGISRFENPLKPCCIGISSSFNCGDVDENGNKMYTLCDDPATAFYWDANHPTQAGWEAVFSTLEDTIQQAVY